MRGAEGRMLAAFEIYRISHGRQMWSRFTVTDSAGRELIRAVRSSATDSSLLPVAADALFETVTDAATSTHPGCRVLEAETGTRDH